MRNLIQVLQIACTYIGTIVGAGFATGQEILQFFTRFGGVATLMIGLTTMLFIWLGTKIMLLAHDIGARSYEDLNTHLFGEKIGKTISYAMLFLLFGITSVMLAGGGSIFQEHFNLPYQFGLLVTLIFAYIVIMKGIKGIFTVNSFVVPLVLIFTVAIVIVSLQTEQANAWFTRPNPHGLLDVFVSPFLYIGLNLALAQAVLVPIGSSITNRQVVRWGGIIGGLGIGLLLLAGHIALSVRMPSIAQFEIPMGVVVSALGSIFQLLYLFLIYGEVFTTLIANVYGLSLQIETKFKLTRRTITLTILVICYFVSQIGFSSLLSTLYPLFGAISLFWLLRMALIERVQTHL